MYFKPNNKSGRGGLHLLCLLLSLLQLGLVLLRLLLQPPDFRQHLGLLLSAGCLQGFQRLPLLIQFTALSVQSGPGLLQIILALLQLLGTRQSGTNNVLKQELLLRYV